MLFITVIISMYFAYMLWESISLRRARASIKHIIHVNGTRGKSSVTRLIAAGLKENGFLVYCKTTGTDPVTIDVNGNENLIRRRGRANIKEQIGIVKNAAMQQADILVIECMAINPVLQNVLQNKILLADIGVITNVRHDHMDVMGNTLEEICDSLCNTIPKSGVIFTADAGMSDRIKKQAHVLASQAFLAKVPDKKQTIDFSENVALALKVCEYVGVPEDVAMQGMTRYSKDPFALKMYDMGDDIFVNGFSINDIDSIDMVWNYLSNVFKFRERKLVLLINNRTDRGSRTKDMLKMSKLLSPSEIWLLGSAKCYFKIGLFKNKDIKVYSLKKPYTFPENKDAQPRVIYAIGNIANEGREIIKVVEKRGKEIVS